jgi:hypothetical protein
MAGEERDSTQDWLLPEQERIPTVRELEGRIDEALATARSSEAAVMAVGDAAIDAAQQARRAAELAERASGMAAHASAAAERASAEAGRASSGSPDGSSPDGTDRAAANQPSSPGPGPGGPGMRDFNARADRIAARLQRLQRLPVAAGR